VCGAIAHYNATEPPPGPRNLGLFISRRLRMRGFIVGDHAHLAGEFAHQVGGWLREGRITFRETVVDGLENAPDVFLGMLRGENTGKMLVRLADPAA
jgi:NADPH-dependent curcumin reductase CurA